MDAAADHGRVVDLEVVAHTGHLHGAALDGGLRADDWAIDFQGAILSGAEARVKLAYTATQEVRVVLGGSGTVVATVDGKKVEIDVEGSPDSDRLLTTSGSRTGEIELTVPTGVTVYSFTFG